jgi:hypothetical protein
MYILAQFLDVNSWTASHLHKGRCAMPTRYVQDERGILPGWPGTTVRAPILSKPHTRHPSICP